MPSYPPGGLDGQYMTSLSTREMENSTGRGQGARGSRATPSSAARLKTPESRREPSQQLNQPPLPSDHPLYPSISSSGRAGMWYGTHSRARGIGNRSSATWTSSSDGGGGGGCDLANLSDSDEVQDRSGFVAEYNRLAGKHGIRPLIPTPLAYSSMNQSPEHRHSQQKISGWFSRTFLRQPSAASSHASGNASTVIVRPSEARRASHKRSMSDLAIQIMQPILKKDTLKGEDLQSLVRLCGKSILYLPSEYAPGSLILPTCLRATAQYLVQHAADTRGVFRIPGSVKVVGALYDYYCAEGNADDITSTIRCPNLPQHIKATTHDVASTFKRLLSGLPGGILGSLPLLDAMVAIHSQLNGDPELTRTKQSKLRARLIALAIGTVESQFRRELICAVFGLLCLIGRAAETAPREDDHGRPLPTADLMGYNALGIVFGPLLASDLLNSYTMRLAHPSVGLVLFPVTPPNVRKDRRRSRIPSGEDTSPHGSLIVDKIHVANSITEMLITHWRDVVKHMRSLDILRPCAIDRERTGSFGHYSTGGLRPSASESFMKRKPAEWTAHRSPRSTTSVQKPPLHDMAESPVPPSPTPDARRRSSGRSRSRIWGCKENGSRDSSLVVQRQRPKLSVRSASATRAAPMVLPSMLSPTAEESASLHDFETSPGSMVHTANSHNQSGYRVPPLMYYTLPMEVPPPRGHPDDQLEADIGGGVDRVNDRARLSAHIAGESASEIEAGSVNPTHPTGRRGYRQISRKGAAKSITRPILPDPATPQHSTTSHAGGQPESVLPSASDPAEGRLQEPMGDSRQAPGKGSSFRVRNLSSTGELQQGEREHLPKDSAIYNASRAQRRDRRLARRGLRGTRSSRSSHGSSAHSDQIERGHGEAQIAEVGGSGVSGQANKSSLFPNWKHHLHKPERSSEAPKLDVRPGATQLSARSKNKMRLSFHLRKSASESGAASQERPRGPRSLAASRSEDQHHHERVSNYVPQDLSFRGGKKQYSEMGNESFASDIPPAEARFPKASRSSKSRNGLSQPSLGALDDAQSSGVSTRRRRGNSSNVGSQGSQGLSRENPMTPSRIPLRRGRTHSRAEQLQVAVREKGREISISGSGQDSHVVFSGTVQSNQTEEIPGDGDAMPKSDERPASKTPSTPPQSAHKDFSRVKTPNIPTRTSSVNRQHPKSPIRKTPFPTLSQVGPTTPSMESPSRRPRGQTGSSVKAMAAMFESGNTNSPSPLKPPVPVFGIPTPIMQQKNTHKGAIPSRRKIASSSSSVVGEYTVNPMTPSRGLRKSQTTGDNVGKSFSLSPTKKSCETGTGGSGLAALRKSVDSTASAEGRSERSWVTVVPIAGGENESSYQTKQKSERAEVMEGDGNHPSETVGGEKVAMHPAWRDSDVFWAAQEDMKTDNGAHDAEKLKQPDECDSGSVVIARSLASDSFEPGSGLREGRGSQSRGRRVPSMVSTGNGSEKRIVSTIMSPNLLENLVTRSLSGKKPALGTPMKGTPVEPEVDLSTAVASMSPRPQPGSCNSDEKGTGHSMTVETDNEEDPSESRGILPPQKGEQDEAPQDDFVLPAQMVEFSDLDMEIQQHQSQYGLSPSRERSDQEISKISSSGETKDAGAARTQVLSPAPMEMPYSVSGSFEIARARAETFDVPSRAKADIMSPKRNALDAPSASRKSTGASSNDIPGSASSRGIRGSSSSIALHAQIRSLQRQLEQRTEQVRQLRRLVDMKENPRRNMDICTLSEKLSEAEKECKMWRERAEAAERRVAMFKKITARVRNKRLGMTTSEKKDDGRPEGLGEAHDGGNDIKGKGKEKEQYWEQQLRQSSNEMHTEDEGAVADRIRAALHGEAGRGRKRGVGRGIGGGYSFPADGENENEGAWRDSDTNIDDDDHLDGSPDAKDEGGMSSHGQVHGQPLFESTMGFGSPSRRNSTDGRSYRNRGSSSPNWWEYYMSRPDDGIGQDTMSEVFGPEIGGKSSGGLIRRTNSSNGGNGTGTSPIDAGIDDDNRSSTSTMGSPPGTARNYKSVLMAAGMEDMGEGERLSRNSDAEMWVRAVESGRFVYSDEKTGDGAEGGDN